MNRPRVALLRHELEIDVAYLPLPQVHELRDAQFEPDDVRLAPAHISSSSDGRPIVALVERPFQVSQAAMAQGPQARQSGMELYALFGLRNKRTR